MQWITGLRKKTAIAVKKTAMDVSSVYIGFWFRELVQFENNAKPELRSRRIWSTSPI